MSETTLLDTAVETAGEHEPGATASAVEPTRQSLDASAQDLDASAQDLDASAQDIGACPDADHRLARRGLLGLALAGGAMAAMPRRAAALNRSKTMRPRPQKKEDSRLFKGTPSPPIAAVIALNRMGFGPRPGDVNAFNALGGNAQSRLQAYVAQQLAPESIDDSVLEARLAAANFESIGISDNPDTYRATLWSWYINDGAPSGNTSSNWPKDELIRAKFLRAMYSRRQLKETLADFWHDHFNVFIEDSSFVRAMFPHLDLILRQNLLGNFRQMLEAVTRSSSMLYYLDNYTSSNAGPNENFCRELFELHTLGAENYLGVMQQNEVPTDGDGLPVGYVDADVFEATRAFTGWSFSFGSGGDGDTGLFFYRPDWHDRFQKTVLGVFLPQDQSDLKDGNDVLDALASHPGTGRHIARKLCEYYISDEPPQNVIDAAAAVFTSQWQAPDQLKQVMETILLAPEFLSTWGEKVKRPFHIAVSALRAGNANFTLKMNDDDTSSFLGRFDNTGHEPFHWPAPNGFSNSKIAWTSMTPRVMAWRLLGWLIDFDNDNDVYYLDVLSQTPSDVRSANQLADFWVPRLLGRTMDPADRQEIVDFMANGINPTFDLNLGDDNTSSRLRAMVGLIFMSPDFLWR